MRPIEIVAVAILSLGAMSANGQGPVVSGCGTATVDGTMATTEWQLAAVRDFWINVPEGGIAPATLLLMNDQENLYLALKVERSSLDSLSHVMYLFDNDNDGVGEDGDDFLAVYRENNGRSFTDAFYSSTFVNGSLTFDDYDRGGTTDGAGRVANDGSFTFFELSHPLDSSDDSNDFSLAGGETVGLNLTLTLGYPQAGTRYPDLPESYIDLQAKLCESDNDDPGSGDSTDSEDAAVYGGVKFPAGAVSFADKVIRYDPTFRGGIAPDETQQDARQILGVPEQGEMSLGRGGRIYLQFLDNSLTGSNDSQADLYVFEIGDPETTLIDISRDYVRWFRVGSATGFASGIDIDQFGFDANDRISFVRITDDGGTIGGHDFTAGADLVAVGARSSAPPSGDSLVINYQIQAHVGGRSELIIQGSRLQWHHLKGSAPGLERQFWSPGKDANSPTIIDSNLGPNITWVPTGWPVNLGNGTHSDSYSSVFNGLTPVFPSDGRCWRLEKRWGDGDVEIVQQPNASNNYSLVIRFDDLITGTSGGLYHLTGSGFYSVYLSRTFKAC